MSVHLPIPTIPLTHPLVTVFLWGLCVVIVIALADVTLDTYILLSPINWMLAHVKPPYGPIPRIQPHPYFATGILLTALTTLFLFFSNGLYSEKIGYANKSVAPSPDHSNAHTHADTSLTPIAPFDHSTCTSTSAHANIPSDPSSLRSPLLPLRSRLNHHLRHHPHADPPSPLTPSPHQPTLEANSSSTPASIRAFERVTSDTEARSRNDARNANGRPRTSRHQSHGGLGSGPDPHRANARNHPLRLLANEVERIGHPLVHDALHLQGCPPNDGASKSPLMRTWRAYPRRNRSRNCEELRRHPISHHRRHPLCLRKRSPTLTTSDPRRLPSG